MILTCTYNIFHSKQHVKYEFWILLHGKVLDILLLSAFLGRQHILFSSVQPDDGY